MQGAVAAAGHHRKHVASVGKVETHGKRAVATNLDRLAAKRHQGIGLRRAVNDQLSIHLELEGRLLGRVARRARAEQCDRRLADRAA